jgi:hypothetical protein
MKKILIAMLTIMMMTPMMALAKAEWQDAKVTQVLSHEQYVSSDSGSVAFDIMVLVGNDRLESDIRLTVAQWKIIGPIKVGQILKVQRIGYDQYKVSRLSK